MADGAGCRYQAEARVKLTDVDRVFYYLYQNSGGVIDLLITINCVEKLIAAK